MQNIITVEGYQITEVFFESKNSIVYRGLKKKDNQAVVIKLLNRQYPEPEELAKFRQEYEIAKSMDIAGVIKIYNLQQHGNSLLIVMEDFFGESLQEIKQNKEISLKEFLALGIRIAGTLSEIHKQNIIHKDINPTNIVWNRTENIVKIIDFSISTQLSHEITEIINPNQLEGILNYISPEQTGRINRSIDYRTDLYSLGVTFYEILTNQLPFWGSDSMELVHSHIAKVPRPPHTINSSIPQVISNIVMKLLAKNSEERYQNALGLKYDLEKCLEQLNTTNEVKPFKIAQRDFSEKFRIPQKLYGREEESELLLNTFAKASGGLSELFLVGGQPGIGKTALVNEILKPIVEKNGYFIKGKFDQFKVNIPYSAISQAFNYLIKEILSEPEDILNQWKTNLLEAFGPNGQIIIDIIPEIEQVIGKQPRIQELNPTEAQNRFLIIFRNFVKVIAQANHPFVLFLDDLQWCDQSSLNLIKDLTTKSVPYFMLICAYRDNEVGEGHPFNITLGEIGKTHTYEKLLLQPLAENFVLQLISDTMHCALSGAELLSDIVYKKTNGNPFFINGLLKNLYKQKLLDFNHSTGHWNWELDKIKNTKTSDNVVEFMIERLQTLPADCLSVLKFASCVGNRFDLKTISVIMQKNIVEISNILWGAVQEEVIFTRGNKYRITHSEGGDKLNISYEFQHDRIQQAAYSLIEDNKKQETHLQIGRLSLINFTETEKEEHLIEIVNHINVGRALIKDSKEKEQLILLNLKAGNKAQSASAYTIALQLFDIGISLLPENPWKNNYELTFDLYKGFSQCAYLCGKYTEAEQFIEIILQNAQSKIEKINIISMRLRQYATVGKPNEAIEEGIKGLALLGVKLSAKPGALAVLLEIIKAKIGLGKRKITDLLNAPVLEDEEKKMIARLLTEMGASAYVLGNDNLYGILALKVVNLSLRFGNIPESPYAYVAYGMLLSVAFGDYKSSYEFGKLALALNEKLNDIEYKCRVIAAYGVLTHHWNNHWSTLSEYFQKGVDAGIHSGDLFYLGHNACNCVVWNPKLHLQSLIEQYSKYLAVSYDTGFQDAIDTAEIHMQKYRNFRGQTYDRLSMNDENFDEENLFQSMSNRKYISGIAIYHFQKADINLFYDNYEQAYYHVKESDKIAKSLIGLNYVFLLSVVAFHSASACLSDKSITLINKKELLKRLRKEHKNMKKWAKHKPENYLHVQQTMEAEMAKHKGYFKQAADLYNQAIINAKNNEWYRDEAFANELAAKFYLELNQERAAIGYMQEAHYHYNRWGATAKVQFLEEKYPDLFKSIASHVTKDKDLQTVTATFSDTSTRTQGVDTLDLFTIMKSSQAISGEIMLETLLKKLMEIVIENAGAQRGLLLLMQNNELRIQAETNTEKIQVAVLQDIPVSESQKLPESLINYVVRSKNSVVLSNAVSEGQFTHDPYVINNQLISVLAMPIIKQNELYGILYLENNLTADAFTAERQEVLNILSSQIAISIENSLLYENLEQKVKERTEEYVAINEELNVANYELQIEIKERQKIEQTLLENKKKLLELNATKDKFFSIIAHDLRSPFNVLLGYSNLLLENHTKYTEEEREKYIKFINDSSIKTYKLLENLLTWARSQLGGIDFSPRKINIKALINEVILLLSETAGNKNIKILDKTENSLFMYADKNMIDTVMRNLILNAIKFTPKGGDITIKAHTIIDDNNQKFAEIIVKDSGVGILPEIQSKLFKITENISTKGTEKETGTGLGLILCKEFVEKHGGKIWVESEVENLPAGLPATRHGKAGGSEFIFRIPQIY